MLPSCFQIEISLLDWNNTEMQNNHCGLFLSFTSREEIPMYLSQSHLKIKMTAFGAVWCSMSPPLLQLTFQKGTFKKILFIFFPHSTSLSLLQSSQHISSAIFTMSNLDVLASHQKSSRQSFISCRKPQWNWRQECCTSRTFQPLKPEHRTEEWYRVVTRLQSAPVTQLSMIFAVSLCLRGKTKGLWKRNTLCRL